MIDETRQQRRHPVPQEYEFPIAARLNAVIEDTEKELAFSRVQEWARVREVADPTHMGKQQAENELGLYQQHCRFLEEKIALIRLFQKEKCNV